MPDKNIEPSRRERAGIPGAMMEQNITRELVAAIAGALPEADAAWEKLATMGSDVVPFLAEAFPKARKWQGRVSLVFHCVRHARTSSVAFDLGLLALQDKSYMVRYRACGLLAYSLQKRAIPDLRRLLRHSDHRTVEDATAAIDAIENQNHHFFVDRSHTGRSFWEVNPGDRQT
jgi:hypothetical protein